MLSLTSDFTLLSQLHLNIHLIMIRSAEPFESDSMHSPNQVNLQSSRSQGTSYDMVFLTKIECFIHLSFAD